MRYFWRYLGIKRGSSLGENEIQLLTQLQNNRLTALQNIHADLKNELLSSVYPDKQLKTYVRITVGNTFIHDELRLAFLEYLIRLSITTKGFGERLIIYHNMNPEIIIKIMLQNISIT